MSEGDSIKHPQYRGLIFCVVLAAISCAAVWSVYENVHSNERRHAAATAKYESFTECITLLRDKRVITAFIAEAISPEAARKAEGLTGNAQKDMLTAALAADEDGAGTRWSPDWMQVPPTRHIEGAASPPADAWDRIARLFALDVQGAYAGAASSPLP